jgi:hypothetical protein
MMKEDENKEKLKERKRTGQESKTMDEMKLKRRIWKRRIR